MSDRPIVLYGIPNCDRVRKARAWLDSHDIAYLFHDFKKSGVGPDLIATWQAELGWEAILNRQGTTWRQLPEDRKAQVRDAVSAARLMSEFPSVIRRPVLQVGHCYLAGFDESEFQKVLKG